MHLIVTVFFHCSGGVSDIEESDEQLSSICHDDCYQYVFDLHKWYPVTLRNVNDKDAKDSTKQTRPCPRFNTMMAVSKNVLYL